VLVGSVRIEVLAQAAAGASAVRMRLRLRLRQDLKTLRIGATLEGSCQRVESPNHKTVDLYA